MNNNLDARLRRGSVISLSLVAIGGAVLSYASLYRAAVPTFGPYLATGFPFLTDALILGATLRFIVGSRNGTSTRHGWRLVAHSAVIGTVTLNAFASPSLADIPWHIAAPLAWSVLVELSGREMVGEYRRTSVTHSDRIPVRLWIAAPFESVRTALLMARLAEKSAVAARVSVGVHDATRQALRMTVADRRSRAVVRRQIRAGIVHPSTVVNAIGWDREESVSARDVLRSVLTNAMCDPALYSRPDTEIKAIESIELTSSGEPSAVRSVDLTSSNEINEGINYRFGEKRTAFRAALARCGGDVSAAIDLSRSEGIEISTGYAYQVSREVGKRSENVA